MANVEIYTKGYCPFCHRAKALLKSKGVRFKEIDITDDAFLLAEMKVRSGRRTVPQVFINEEHIGGSDDLFSLDRQGGLDTRLASEPA